MLDFLLEHDNVQAYLDNQNAVPCKDEEFELASEVDGMREYISEGKMTDYQDHYYPSEMGGGRPDSDFVDRTGCGCSSWRI